MTKEEQWKKEAERTAVEKYGGNIVMVGAYETGFIEGAEFGYNKANEWHDLRKNLNDLPKESGKYFVAIPNENGFIKTDVARFRVSFGWEYFDIFVDEYGREHIIAWKEYPTFL